MRKSAHLYRAFDAERTLLYVGISIAPLRRLYTHAHGSGWWPDVATVTIERYPSRGAARAAELVAIRDEQPRHNIAGCGVNAPAQALKYRELRRATRRSIATEKALKEVGRERDEMIRKALAMGMPYARIGEATGLSEARLLQIRRGARI